MENWSPVAFGLSLASGILIIIFGGIIPSIVTSDFGIIPTIGRGGMMDGWGMIGGGGMMMGWFNPGFVFGGWFFTIPLIAGSIIIIGSILMKIKPHLNTAWSIIVIVFSVIGLGGMGLSFFGSILGIAGGIIGLSSGTSSSGSNNKG